MSLLDLVRLDELRRFLGIEMKFKDLLGLLNNQTFMVLGNPFELRSILESLDDQDNLNFVRRVVRAA
jgi:hypothetical protein